MVIQRNLGWHDWCRSDRRHFDIPKHSDGDLWFLYGAVGWQIAHCRSNPGYHCRYLFGLGRLCLGSDKTIPWFQRFSAIIGLAFVKPASDLAKPTVNPFSFDCPLRRYCYPTEVAL